MILNKLNTSKETFIGGGISIGAFIIYMMTLCPTINFIDSGELATVAYTLGIAHPTGYPLFSLITWSWAHIPFGLRPIVQLNVLAAVLCSVGLFVFYRFMVYFLRTIHNPRTKSNKAEKTDSLSSPLIPVAAAYATLTLAFSETYWSQALSIEVYSLHILLLSILLLLFVKASHMTRTLLNGKEESKENLYWYLFAVVLGLAFTNHMTTILLAPAFLYMYFIVHSFGGYAWKRIARLVIPFIVGFSVYLYLPVRASQHPIMNWGNPVDFEKFIWHFSGKVYRVWIFSSMESAGKQLNYFIQTLGDEFAYLPLVVAVLGVGYLFKYSRRLFYFSVLLFLGCIFYSINYDIHDIDSYFLLAYFSVAVWTGAGVCQIGRWVQIQSKVRITGYFLLVSCLLNIPFHYKSVNQSQNTIVERYTGDMFKYIEQQSIVISYQWDYFISAAYYFQNVENMRQDVVVIDKELLRRSWYYEQLKTRYPWLVERSKNEIDLFLKELYKFEHDQPYNGQVIEARYVQVIKSIIKKNIGSRSVYVTPEVEGNYTAPYRRVPAGLAFRLVNEVEHYDVVKPEFELQTSGFMNKYVDAVNSLYSRAYLNHAIYFQSTGNRADVLPLLEKALEVQPDFREALYLKQKILRGG